MEEAKIRNLDPMENKDDTKPKEKEFLWTRLYIGFCG